jgi:hypothetical protein
MLLGPPISLNVEYLAATADGFNDPGTQTYER